MPQKLKCYYFAVEEINCFLVKKKVKDYAMHSQIVRFEGGIDLVTIIKGTSFYHCGKYHDCCQITCHLHLLNSRSYMNQIERWLNAALSSVMLSTTEDGKVVKGLTGVPLEGPVLYIGYHMLLGLEVISLVSEFLTQRNILLRGIAHPLLFERLREGRLPDASTFDSI
ncbi:hypothetical protein SLEP1_g56595 [Rubroshorea leprosula]|uniref:Uncharacterized protein n=1 Tax=Rubroshorea leprosula TaxID=152421 RepID=A0AAV5MM68_9ROSI|nr:hypothetical protein SLEP1_g56595 [Rubroshorea leprosula]